MSPESMIARTFGVPVAVLPVIHLQSPMQAIEEAECARDCGAQGVFFIAHDGPLAWRQALTAHAVREATTRLAPFWLALVGIFSGGAIRLGGAALEHVAPWSDAASLGGACGVLVGIACVVEAVRRSA